MYHSTLSAALAQTRLDDLERDLRHRQLRAGAARTADRAPFRRRTFRRGLEAGVAARPRPVAQELSPCS